MAAIPKATYQEMLLVMDFGNITAENDGLLDQARVETPAFTDLLQDKVDLILGCKGAGKTAMFKLCTQILRDEFFKHMDTILINGADEPKGDPVFHRYFPSFEAYSESEFENFWRIYFIYLLNDQIFRSGNYSQRLKVASKTLKAFEAKCEECGLTPIKTENSLMKIIHVVVEKVQSIRKVEGKVGLDGSMGGGVEFGDNPGLTTQAESAPIFINELLSIVKNVLAKSRLKVWIMLDRLDEVFPRRSSIETKALRSLLKCIRSFGDEQIRLKIFLRDDIFESVTDGGFTALTHIADRSSGNLRWKMDEILNLVIKRVLSNESIRKHYHPDMQMIENNNDYRETVFYQMFPPQIKKGANQQPTLEWLYKRCEDGKGVVAPRDIIDLLREAKKSQQHIFNSNKTDQQWLLSPKAIANGFTEMSKRKKDVCLKAEFSHVFNDILVFENGKAEHNFASLQKLLGKSWPEKVKTLESIGFIKKTRKRNSYHIPYLYRPCLGIKQGKSDGVN